MSHPRLDQVRIPKAAARNDAERRSPDPDTSNQWHVRIAWMHAPGVTWPPFSYARAETQRDAEAEASRAITFGYTSADVCAVATFVRAPGETEWREVARRLPAQTSTEATGGAH